MMSQREWTHPRAVHFGWPTTLLGANKMRGCAQDTPAQGSAEATRLGVGFCGFRGRPVRRVRHLLLQLPARH